MSIPAGGFSAALTGMAFTMEFWLRLEDLSLQQSMNLLYIERETSGPSGSRSWQVGLAETQSGTFVSATVWNATSTASLLAPAPTFGTWLHIALTYNGLGVRLILNGIEGASGPFSGVVPAASSVEVRAWNQIPGRLDELRIWNVARSEAQIAASRSAILSGDTPGLIGYWRFEEGASQVAGDTSTFGSNGQLGTSPGVNAGDPSWSSDGAPVEG